MLHTIKIQTDGSCCPTELKINDGDTVEWTSSGVLPAIIPIDDQGESKPYDANDPNDFTGPLVKAVPGIHCINNPSEPIEETLPNWVWDEIGFTCIYIRLNWQIINPEPGVYDWTSLDPHMNAAIRSGKFFGISVRAGVQETPQWLFASHLGDKKCKPVSFDGIVRTLGLPQDPNYQHWWFEMHKALADHIRSRNAWWQRLVSVRVSGANYHSAEAKLPNREIGEKNESGPVPCQPDWQIWQDAGYTPDGLYTFYRRQGNLFIRIFPGKSICYPLIQAGFPRANAADSTNRPKGFEQTEYIIDMGRRLWGDTWVVQHLGLQALRCPPNSLPHSDSHPVTSDRGVEVKDGNPNQWALRAGIAGSPTAGQTMNDIGAERLESALENAWKNSDYIWVEVYAKDVRPSFDNGSGSIGSSGYTLKDWSLRFYDWRMERWGGSLEDPYPGKHTHTFSRTETCKKLQVLKYRTSVGVEGVIEIASGR